MIESLAPPSEQRPLPLWTILGVLLGVLAFIVMAVVLLIWTRTPPFRAAVAPAPPAPDERRADEYGWVEKPTPGKPGVVRVPAERAAELWLAEEGKR